MNHIDLGDLECEVLLFGGPYSNLQATQAILAQQRARGIPETHCICTGDLVAYCADPAAVVARVRATGMTVVAGNCEKQLAARALDCGCGFETGTACDILSAGWYGHANAHINEDDRDWMAGLPDVVTFTHSRKRFAVVHGGMTDIARFIWPCSSDAVFAEEGRAIEAVTGPVDAVVAGHSGIAFQRTVAGLWWINAGVIGLPPHDGRPETRYAILGPEGVVFHRLAYDVAGAVNAMQAHGLTQGYDRALQTGIWPSEDVLPTELRR